MQINLRPYQKEGVQNIRLSKKTPTIRGSKIITKKERTKRTHIKKTKRTRNHIIK